MCSSKNTNETGYLEGIFSADPNESSLYDANRVFVYYCSSDSWWGDSVDSSHENTWTFQGRRIVRATIFSLILNTDIIKKPNQLVIFGGGSAGSIGGSYNLNSVADTLESYGTGLKVVGYLDSSAAFFEY